MSFHEVIIKVILCIAISVILKCFSFGRWNMSSQITASRTLINITRYYNHCIYIFYFCNTSISIKVTVTEIISINKSQFHR
ncbi:hypothetical protein D3C78_1016020 [compost metagenome]